MHQIVIAMNISALVRGAPQGRTESALLQGGESYSLKPHTLVTWDVCPPLHRPPTVVEDLRGTRRGSMIVIGYDRRVKRGDHAWIARCDCGIYEVRRGRAWRRGLANTTVDSCQWCKKLDHHRYKLSKR